MEILYLLLAAIFGIFSFIISNFWWIVLGICLAYMVEDYQNNQ